VKEARRKDLEKVRPLPSPSVGKVELTPEQIHKNQVRHCRQGIDFGPGGKTGCTTDGKVIVPLPSN